MSDRRKLTSPENGRLAKGPITQAGKERSSRNAIRHGLLSRLTVLTDENPEFFENSLKAYYARFQPQDEAEEALVDDMASAYWRIQRLGAIETTLLNKEIGRQTGGQPLERVAGAFTVLAENPGYNLLQRYDARLHRNFQRALRTLIDLKTPFAITDPATEIPELPAQEPNLGPPPSEPPSETIVASTLANPEPPIQAPPAVPPSQVPAVPPSQVNDSPAAEVIDHVRPSPRLQLPPEEPGTRETKHPPNDPNSQANPWEGLKAA